jgi:hypothetical protein
MPLPMPDGGDPEIEPVGQVATVTREIRTVVVEVPLAEPPSGHIPKTIEFASLALKPHQGVALRRFVEGLMLRGATLRNGREVKFNADAIKWFLEQVD